MKIDYTSLIISIIVVLVFSYLFNEPIDQGICIKETIPKADFWIKRPKDTCEVFWGERGPNGPVGVIGALREISDVKKKNPNCDKTVLR